MSKPLVQEYDNFIKENFKGLTLKAPLFYNWDKSLRFDLQPNAENPVTPDMTDYFETVLNRSTDIFESAFSNDDEIFIILYQYKWPSRKKIKLSNFVFRQIKDLKKGDVEFSIIKRLYEPNDNDEIWNRAIIKTKVANLNYRVLLKAIAHYDFPFFKPNVQLETYILNTTKKMIFHMYDDRGLDIASSQKKSLATLYNKHENWLLDYDIETMRERIKDVL